MDSKDREELDNILNNLLDRRIAADEGRKNFESITSAVKNLIQENEKNKKKIGDMEYFLENSEMCPECHKLILSSSTECKNCGNELIHE